MWFNHLLLNATILVSTPDLLDDQPLVVAVKDTPHTDVQCLHCNFTELQKLDYIANFDMVTYCLLNSILALVIT